ncbi:MAG: efflux RND transporter permease subunit [Deltaproteobacteria bacterium]|nr:MAG: efflux RND transporter permease subunit [Deltaproteobacteria bacterium]
MNLPGLSIARPVFTTMVMFAIALFGLVLYQGLEVDQFPEVDLPVVTVVTIYPGADPETVENQVTTPIEDALFSLGGLDELQSVSLSSVSQVIVNFELGTDVNVAAQDIRDALATVDLPDQVEEPIIQRVDLGATPILQLAVTGPGELTDLVRYVEGELEPELKRIDGVGNIDVFGAQDREIHIWLDPARLAATGLTVDDVTRVLGAQNIEIPGGRIDNGELEMSLRASAAVETPDDFAEIALVTMGDAVVRLGDIARVEDGVEEARSTAFLDGQPAVALLVRKQSDGNTVAVAHGVHDALPGLLAAAPAGTEILPVLDNSRLIESSIETVQFDIVLGGFLAVAIILLFLRDWRATLISATALPVSVIGTFAFVGAMGFTLNMLTTLALSLSIGILIDDAIVVIENIVRRKSLGEDAMTAARNGTSEIMLAVLATTLSIVAVFVPVAFMDGMIGQFFFEFGMTVAFAVLMSLFVSFTLTPMLSSRFLGSHDAHHGETGISGLIGKVLGAIEGIYRRLVRGALRHPVITLAVAFASLGATVLVAGLLEFEFTPAEDAGQYEVSIELPAGTSLQETERRAADMADRVAAMGGVTHVLTTVGGGVQEKVNTAKLLVKLPHKTQRSFTQEEAMRVTRTTLADEPNAIVTVAPIEVTNIGGGRNAALELQLRGADLDALSASTEAVVAALSDLEGFVDVDSSLRLGKPELSVRVDPKRAADLGVVGATVATTVRTLVAGVVPTTFEEDGERYDVRVQLDSRDRASTAAVERAQVRASDGSLVRVGDVAAVTEIRGPSQIDHAQRERQVVIYANLDGKALGTASTEALEAAKAAASEGVRVSLGGRSERLAETGGAMFAAMGLALALVYMILASQFESFIHPLTIMASVPFAFIGAFLALVITGQAMSIFGMIGMIMLVGLVTKNAILLVDFALQRLAEGDAIDTALETAGATRLMPILMTTAAMVFGMLPVALGHGDGGESRAPMGLAVIGGLLSSTVLTLVVVPVVFQLVEKLRRRMGASAPVEAPIPDLAPAVGK